MPEIFDREQIERALQGVDVTGAIEEGFVAYSEGKVVVPPVGKLVFEDPPGDVHIKYGCIKKMTISSSRLRQISMKASSSARPKPTA